MTDRAFQIRQVADEIQPPDSGKQSIVLLDVAATQKALATKSVRGPESDRENRTACYRKFTLDRISDARYRQIFHQPRDVKQSDEE